MEKNVSTLNSIIASVLSLHSQTPLSNPGHGTRVGRGGGGRICRSARPRGRGGRSARPARRGPAGVAGARERSARPAATQARRRGGGDVGPQLPERVRVRSGSRAAVRGGQCGPARAERSGAAEPAIAVVGEERQQCTRSRSRQQQASWKNQGNINAVI